MLDFWYNYDFLFNRIVWPPAWPEGVCTQGNSSNQILLKQQTLVGYAYKGYTRYYSWYYNYQEKSYFTDLVSHFCLIAGVKFQFIFVSARTVATQLDKLLKFSNIFLLHHVQMYLVVSIPHYILFHHQPPADIPHLRRGNYNPGWK